MSASTKLRQLESKLSSLQNQHQILLKERQQEIAVLLSTIDLAHLDDKVLVGGLLFLKDKITNQDPIVEAWRDAGETFLQRTKPRRSFKFQGIISLPKKLQRLRQQLNRLKSTLNRERNKMKQQHQSDRKARTRLLIQIGGILHKSGLMDAFSIATGADLQDYKNREKAAALLGFLVTCFEKNSFDDANLGEWRSIGKRLLREN